MNQLALCLIGNCSVSALVDPEAVLRLTTDASVTSVLERLPFVLDRDLTLLLGSDESISDTVGELGRRWFGETRR